MYQEGFFKTQHLNLVAYFDWKGYLVKEIVEIKPGRHEFIIDISASEGIKLMYASHSDPSMGLTESKDKITKMLKTYRSQKG